jgi:AraC-like DNA-binding protein
MQSAYATDVPEQAEEFLAGAYSGDVDLSLPDEAGTFRFAVDRVDAQAFRLDSMEIGARAAIRYEPDEEEFFVSTIGRGTLRVLQRGTEERFLPGEPALIGRPGVETRAEIADFQHGVVVLRAASLRAAAGLEPDGEELPMFASIRPVSARHARTWNRAVDFVTATLREDPVAFRSSLVLGATERLLTGLALVTFPNSAVATPARRDDHDSRSSATLRRAVAFIEANPESDVGIGEIAAAARVSRRCVQLAFRRHLDTTPTAYLRQVRLDAAHRQLLAAAPGEGLTVTEVAYRWGFSSPSRFTERYRAAFGATPSATLRR